MTKEHAWRLCLLAAVWAQQQIGVQAAVLRANPKTQNLDIRGAHNARVDELTERIAIRKPVTDKRDYLHTTFKSGLRVLAVHDPEAEKSAFSVAVEAGSLEDPADFQGLAHFCEHMLFLGSAKYPDKEAFSKQLALFGGTHNAYTSSEETVYFNEIGNEGFEKGLDIFAQFFISPSFDESMVDKEIHAVDSEHKKNQPDTQRRLWHLLRSRANPKNPMHQFATGDLQTLKLQPEKEGKSLVKALREFHTKNYCAGRLHLVLISNKTTSDLLEVAHRHFDDLPASSESSCPSRPVYSKDTPYSKSQGNLGRSFTVGTHGAPELWIVLPMPSLKQRYKELSEAYVWNALAHYGPGSLKALLMKEDLSQQYSYFAENSVAGSVMFITFSLTAKGAKNTDRVLEYFFTYVNSLKKKGVDSKLLNSMQTLRAVEFDYQEKRPSEFDFVRRVASSLPNYAPEDLLTGGVLMDKPNVEHIKEVLSAISADNMNVALVSPSFNESSSKYHEHYYDFGYDEQAIDPALISRMEASSGYGLAPPPNLQYVPTNVTLINEGISGDEPEQLLKKGRVEMWWLGLGEVRLPKAIITMKVGFAPEIVKKAEDSVLSSMHVRLVQQALEESTDALQTCGLSYSVTAQNDGLSISFQGFDEHIVELIKMVLPSVRSLKVTEALFEMTRRQLLVDLADMTKLQPYQHALEAFEVVTVKGRYSRKEMQHVVQDAKLVNMAAHQKFLDTLFAEAQLTMLFAGNIERSRALRITTVVEKALDITRDQKELTHDGYLQVVDPKEEVEVRVSNPIVNDPNSATLAVYQFGVPSIADRVHLAMLGEVIDRPVFEVLRTEHQLGYVVFGYVAPHTSIVEVRVLVQGFREQPDHVEELIESTVQNLTGRIANMGQEEFNTRKSALRTSLTKKAATMSQFAGRYWAQIWDETYCFQKRSLQLAHVDSAEFNSPAPLLEAWKKSVSPSSTRKKVVVKLFGTAPGQAPVELNRQKTGAKVITLVDSESIGEQMQDEKYWPNKFVCK